MVRDIRMRTPTHQFVWAVAESVLFRCRSGTNSTQVLFCVGKSTRPDESLLRCGPSGCDANEKFFRTLGDNDPPDQDQLYSSHPQTAPSSWRCHTDQSLLRSLGDHAFTGRHWLQVVHFILCRYESLNTKNNLGETRPSNAGVRPAQNDTTSLGPLSSENNIERRPG